MVLTAPIGVQRREHEVARLGGGQRDRHGLLVAHLAHHDHVGVLAKRAAQRGCKRGRVPPDLALGHHAAPVAVQVFERVLDREDVDTRYPG